MISCCMILRKANLNMVNNLFVDSKSLLLRSFVKNLQRQLRTHIGLYVVLWVESISIFEYRGNQSFTLYIGYFPGYFYHCKS